MARGLMQGFAQGYGLVSDFENRRDRRREQKRERAQKARQEERRLNLNERKLGLQRARVKATSAHNAAQEKLAGKEFAYKKAAGERADKIAAAKAHTGAIKARRKAADAAAERAGKARKRREQDNLRHLEAAQQAWDSDNYGRAAMYAKAGGFDMANLLDPDWHNALELIDAAASGAPVRKKNAIHGINYIFHNRINAVVGEKGPKGGRIVGARVVNYIPSKDGHALNVELGITALKSDGTKYTYAAPATEGRSPDDPYVLHIPLDKALGKLKGYQVLARTMPKEKVEEALKERRTLLGADKGQSKTEFHRLNNDTLYTNHGDFLHMQEPKHRRRKNFFQMAVKQWGNAHPYGDDNISNREKYRRIEANAAQMEKAYERFQSGDGGAKQGAGKPARAARTAKAGESGQEHVVADPDPAMVELIRKHGGEVAIPSGKYKGKTLTFDDDGNVVIR